MNWSKWILYASLVCILIGVVTAYIAETNQISYYAGLVTGLAIVALIVSVTLQEK